MNLTGIEELELVVKPTHGTQQVLSALIENETFKGTIGFSEVSLFSEVDLHLVEKQSEIQTAINIAKSRTK